MARYVLDVSTSIRVLNEEGVEVGAVTVSGRPAINTGSSQLSEMIDDIARSFADDAADYAKNTIATSTSRTRDKRS